MPRPPSFQTAFLAMALAFSACCQSPRQQPAPPPPISIDDQVRLLALWSHALPLVDAKTSFNGVHLVYRDERGAQHSENADGHLVIRQHFEAAAALPASAPATEPAPARPGADVYLVGQVYGQTAFDAGRNAQNWWFSIFLDTKTAWVGNAAAPQDLSSLGQKQSHAILRADLVPELLGLSPLPAPGAPSDGGQILLMRVNDFDRTNDLFIEQLPDAMDTRGRAFLAKEIRVDRFTGNISEVRMYDPAGVLVVRSQLSDYHAISHGKNAAPPASPAEIPSFPHRVVVSYPAQQTTISLDFSDVSIPAAIRDAAFETPDFQDEGLKVIQAD